MASGSRRNRVIGPISNGRMRRISPARPAPGFKFPSDANGQETENTVRKAEEKRGFLTGANGHMACCSRELKREGIRERFPDG